LAFVVSGRTVLAIDGDLDPTFGTDGKVLTDFDHSTDIANAVAIQADGKLVVVGTTYLDNDFSTEDFAVARDNTQHLEGPSHIANLVPSLSTRRCREHPPLETQALRLTIATTRPPWRAQQDPGRR
jgi:hypothetical protein